MDKDRITGSAKDFAGKVEGAVGDVSGDAKDAALGYAKDSYEKSGDTFRDGSQAIAKSVQDNPLGSLLIAGGIGFALALLMTRPPRRAQPRWRY